MTNRRQRRAETSVTGRPKSVSATNRAEAEYYKSLGVSLKDAGKEAEALPHLRQALALDPSQADVHFMIAVMDRTHPQLGIDIGSFNKSIRDKKPLIAGYKTMVDVFRQHKRYTEALFCQEELCRLNPSEPQALMDYGLLLNLTGDVEKGAVLLSRSFNLAPGNQYAKGIYSTSLYVTEFAAFHPEVKQAMTRCFDQLYDVNLSRMGAVWVGLMRRDPAFAGLFAALDSDDFDAWADSLDETTGAFLKDPYFTRGLRVLVVNDHAVEILLTRLRRYICLAFDTLAANGRIRLFETFLYALAEQCFFNEYVYAQDEAEARAADALAGRGDRAALALLACYRPLYLALPDSADTLHALARKDPDFAHLVKTQFDDPVEEEAIKPTLPAFGALSNAVSQAVRGQYEENPYPRWTTIITRPMPNDDLIVPESQRDLPFDILVAGCGTGRQAISAAIRGPKSRVTAIDLSRASLAYGLRKARETKLAHRVTFTHADILSMKDWPETFDIIECTGVLHHMEDPFLGWQTLAGRLRPGGFMKIGLYSEAARRPVVAAREFIAGRGYPSTVEGIRACRQAIFALPLDNPLQNLTKTGDFYTTSTVRDLIFHVQEHRMTLPQIQGMMNRLGLECIKFSLSDPGLTALYDQRYPDDLHRASIDNWAEIEREFPHAFFNMYQFWCRKAA